MQARKRQPHVRGPARSSKATKLNVDANSERNVAFYQQEGFSCAYPKRLVYPVEGGEMQLEQLRARLPQYFSPPPPAVPNELFGDDMELTMACTTNITLLPGLNSRGIASGVPRPPTTRQPVVTAPTTSSSWSPGDLLDRLHRENGEEREAVGLSVGGGGREDSGEDMSKVLESMVLQKSVEREVERQGHKCPAKLPSQRQEPMAGTQGATEREGIACLKNQENITYQPRPIINPPQLSTSTARQKGCATRLNFSDTESSLGASQLSSITEDLVGGRASVLGHSQFGTSGQSFEVLHDSWRNCSHNASHGKPAALQPVASQQQTASARHFGKPLHRQPLQEVLQYEADVSSFADSYQSYDQSCSFQAAASKSNVSSFNVYEDSAEQSSLAPFHDSWDNSSKNAGMRAGTAPKLAGKAGISRQPLRQQQQKTEERERVVYRAALGVPLEGEGGGVGNMSTVDQSFTQVDICHPKHVPSISTPVSSKIDFTFDVSRIPEQIEVEDLPSPSQPRQHPSSFHHHPPGAQNKRSVVNLSTIKEESSSLKSSRSSACTTASSSSSSSQSGHESHVSVTGGGELEGIEVNPFSPETVNMMLNALSPSVLERVCSVSAALPQLVSGRSVRLGSSELAVVKKVTSGGFGAIYTCRQGKETKVLKVQKPVVKWEIAIISELHTRLQIYSLQSQCFVRMEQSFVFDNASVMVLPHYNYGSLLDLANMHRPQKVNEAVVLYYASELLEVVASLHHCGILHTDIKPDNLMLSDIRSCKSFVAAQGRGLVLIDFGRAVDLTAFPGDLMFHGSCETDGFQCTQMLEGKPWKYEVDYFGIAATVHVLLTGQYMSVVKNSQTNVYQLQKPLPRSQHQSLWSNLLSCLVNPSQCLPLSDMAAEMRTKVSGLKDYVFQGYFTRLTATALNYFSQRS